MYTFLAIATGLLVIVLLAIYQPVFLIFLCLMVVLTNPTLRRGLFSFASCLDLIGIIFDILSLL